MFLIALRTDKEFEKVKNWVIGKGFPGFCVREVANGENEHWHWLLETTYKNDRTFRQRFTTDIPELKGNAAYSASEVKDLEKYERYMCKGDDDGALPEVAWKMSVKYTDEKIEELHAQYWEENRKLKKRKAGSMIDCIVDQCKAERIEWERRDKIGELYIREIVRRGKPLNMFAVKASVNTIQILLCPDDKAVERFAQEL